MNKVKKINSWDILADAFREEMKEYGGLLNLLEEHQELIFKRDPDQLMDKTVAINNQVEACSTLRQQRKELSDAIAEELGLVSDYKLRELVLYMPEPLQFMFEAIINEVNDLITKIKRKLTQNNLILQRASELNKELIEMLIPGGATKTYGKKGKFDAKFKNSSGSCITASA